MKFHWKNYRLMVELLKGWEGKKTSQDIMLKQIQHRTLWEGWVCIVFLCVFFLPSFSQLLSLFLQILHQGNQRPDNL